MNRIFHLKIQMYEKMITFIFNFMHTLKPKQ